MPQSTSDEIVEKYVEMNVAHPFREENGRSPQLWLDAILKQELRQVIDWSWVDKQDYLLAMERSPVRDLEIKALLRAVESTTGTRRRCVVSGHGRNRAGMPDKMITCLFGKAVSAALPFYIAGRFSSGDLPAITIL